MVTLSSICNTYRVAASKGFCCMSCLSILSLFNNNNFFTWKAVSLAATKFKVPLHCVGLHLVLHYRHYAHECRNTQNSSNSDSLITRQLVYTYTHKPPVKMLCQQICLSLYFCKKITCVSVSLLMIWSVKCFLSAIKCVSKDCKKLLSNEQHIYIICVVAKNVPDAQCSFHI